MWPAIIAMLASAALQYNSQNQAAKRQQSAAVQANARQMQMQNEATQAAAKRAQDFDPTKRSDTQQQIQQELTQGYEQQVSGPQLTAQGIQVGATIPDSEASTDYTLASAREKAKSTASLRALAALMGRTGSATELRRREAYAIGDTAGEIGRIKTGANNMWNADQAGVMAAGQPDMFSQLAASALSAYGTSSLAGAGAGGATRTNDMSWLDSAKGGGRDPMGWWLRNGVSGD